MDLVAQLAEVALESCTLHDFHTEFVDLLARATGAEGGSVLTQRSGSSGGDAVFNLDSSANFAAAMALHSAEFSAPELDRILTGATLAIEDAFTSRRLDELNLFRAYLKPLGADRNVFRVWLGHDSVHFYGFSAAKSANHRRFVQRAVPLLDRVFPILALAERTFARATPPPEALPRDLSLEFKLTAAEHEVMSLVLRGLTNPEIAQVLGISVNTVRNRLVVCFKKLGATRRAEAVCVLLESKREQRVQLDSILTYNRVLRNERDRINRGLPPAAG